MKLGWCPECQIPQERESDGLCAECGQPILTWDCQELDHITSNQLAMNWTLDGFLTSVRVCDVCGRPARRISWEDCLAAIWAL